MRLDPVARVINLDLPSPSLSDNRSHESRARAAIESILGQPPLFPLEICKILPDILPSSGYKVQTLVLDGPSGWEVAQVSATGNSLRPYGLAVDLGSTTVVFYLVDLGSGGVVSTLSKTNPQRVHGEDILERILFAGQCNGLETLQSEVVGLFNSSVQEIVAGHGMSPEDICFIALAGNTTMCHFLLGLDPCHICREPYIPVVNRFDLIRPGEIGINVH
ncbi:MAG: ferredoxin, partial [Thermodesulfobacteriota bacterium]|nr:ferredoxin [Thermodesulfobacteriota bacterium]